MCTYQDIDLATLQILCNLSGLLGALRAVEILYAYRHIAQSLHKRAIVLQCKDCCRHKYRHLLAIHSRLKCRAYSHLGLSEAYISADKAIHRTRRLHIALYSLDSSLLIGGLLIAERRLHSLLKVAVGREGKTFARLTLGIEGDKFSRDILNCLFGCSLNLLPSTAAEFMHLRTLSIATLVARDAVERVDIYKEHIAIAIDKFDNLPRLATHWVRQGYKTVKATYTVVDMDNIVAHAQSIELGNGHLLIALNLAIYLIATVAVKYLMLSI